MIHRLAAGTLIRFDTERGREREGERQRETETEREGDLYFIINREIEEKSVSISGNDKAEIIALSVQYSIASTYARYTLSPSPSLSLSES